LKAEDGGIDVSGLRRLAEDVLLARGAGDTAFQTMPSGDDARRMLHDLQVHQVELEMQNEELLRSQAELGAARARYFGLYDLAPVGYCTLDAQGLILEANLTAADLLGLARGALVGQPLERFIAKSEQDNYYLQRRRPHPLRGKQVYEMLMRKSDGNLFWAQLVESESHEQPADGFRRVVLNDISARKRSEADRERLLAAVEQAGDSIVITDLEGSIQYVNPAFEKATGYTRSECLGRNPRMLKGSGQPAALYEELWATLTAGLTWKGRLVNQRKDGSPFTEEALITPVLDGEDNITSYVAVKREIPAAEEDGQGKARQDKSHEPLVLLAEGDPDHLNLTKRMLSNQGFQVLTAGTAAEALAQAKELGERLCLLLCDLQLPDMDGRELARQVLGLVPGIRVLLMSRYSATVGNSTCAEGWNLPMLRKPFTLQALTQKVAETLGAEPLSPGGTNE